VFGRYKENKFKHSLLAQTVLKWRVVKNQDLKKKQFVRFKVVKKMNQIYAELLFFS